MLDEGQAIDDPLFTRNAQLRRAAEASGDEDGIEALEQAGGIDICVGLHGDAHFTNHFYFGESYRDGFAEHDDAVSGKTTAPVALFEDCDLMAAARQFPCAGKTGWTRADDRNGATGGRRWRENTLAG